MFRRLLLYGLLCGALAFLLQLLQEGLGLSHYRFYLILLSIAAIFMLLGFGLGKNWHDSSHLLIRRKLLFEQLTDREQQVALLILKGYSNKEIMHELHVEQSTLKTHINQIYKKGEISNRKEFKRQFQQVSKA